MVGFPGNVIVNFVCSMLFIGGHTPGVSWSCFPSRSFAILCFPFFSDSESHLVCYSFRDSFLGSPVFSSSMNIGCWGAFGFSMSRNRKHGPVRLADLYAL